MTQCVIKIYHFTLFKKTATGRPGIFFQVGRALHLNDLQENKMTAKDTKEEMESKSRFYLVKTAKQARGQIENRLKDINEKYVKKQYKMGKEFMDELKADPVKRIDDLIDDGKDVVKKTREQRIGAVRQTVKKTRTHVQKRFDTINTEGKKVYEGIESDARIIVEEAMAMGKKKLDRIPFKKDLEEKFSKSMTFIPSKLNLPSREEIDNLVSGIDGVNKKVDALSKQTVKA